MIYGTAFEGKKLNVSDVRQEEVRIFGTVKIQLSTF